MELPSIDELYNYNGMISEEHLFEHIKDKCEKIMTEFQEIIKNAIIDLCGEDTDLLRLFDLYCLSLQRQNGFFRAMLAFRSQILLSITKLDDNDNKSKIYCQRLIAGYIEDFKLKEKLEQYQVNH